MTDSAKPVLSHFDESGKASMVDVSAKQATRAHGRLLRRLWNYQRRCWRRCRRIPKAIRWRWRGFAGIQAAKRTSELIPMCHPLALTHVDVQAEVVEDGVRITATAATVGPTGVEMEALTAAAVAALTVYDMTKALDKGDRDSQRAARGEDAAARAGSLCVRRSSDQSVVRSRACGADPSLIGLVPGLRAAAGGGAVMVVIVIWRCDERRRVEVAAMAGAAADRSPELSILPMYCVLISSTIFTIRRAVVFSGFESSAKLRRGLPLGPRFFGSAAWQVLHSVPSDGLPLVHHLVNLSPVRSLGRTCRLVGAGEGPCACSCSWAGRLPAGCWAERFAAIGKSDGQRRLRSNGEAIFKQKIPR